STPAQLRRLADWLSEHQVDEVVMESTAQYWKTVWAPLERDWTPRPRAAAGAAVGGHGHCRGRGRAGEGLGRPGVAPEFRARAGAAPVADGDAHEGPTDAQPGPAPEPAGGAAGTSPPQAVEPGLGPPGRERPADARGAGRRGHRPRGAGGLGRSSLAGHTGAVARCALEACQELSPVYRRLLRMALEELKLLDSQISRLDQEMAELLCPSQDQFQRLAEVPGLGVDSAQQILAEVGSTAATFPSAGQLASWVGACPGENESAEVNYSHRSPKGNRQMRRLLNQAANAA